MAAYTRAIELSDPARGAAAASATSAHGSRLRVALRSVRCRAQFGETACVLFSNRAAALTKLGRFDAALGDADAAAAARPDWAKAHFRRGSALFGARRFAEAVAAYDAGLALEPNNASLAQGRALAVATARQAAAAASADRRVP